MNRKTMLLSGVATLLALSATVSLAVRPPGGGVPRENLTLAVTMTNDPVSNQIKVYDASTGSLLQTLSTNGAGGAAGNARGVRQFDGSLFAAVNNRSNTVAVYNRVGDRLRLNSVVTTTSPPVSVDFGNGHMYVAGATTVDSFILRGNGVGSRDGTARLLLAGGGVPPDGSTAQVGVVDAGRLLVTLKTDPTPGTVDNVTLHNGAITGATPTAVSAPNGALTPFGFSVYPDGTAVISLAHSNQDGLFRDGAFIGAIGPFGAGQLAPCWTTRLGKYVFTANAGSKTISRLVGTGNNIFVDSPVAATIGGTALDLDADGYVLGIIDHTAATTSAAAASHLTLFTVNDFGELTAAGTPIDLGAANANGVAIMSVPDDTVED